MRRHRLAPRPQRSTLAVSIRYRADAPFRVAIGPGAVALPAVSDWTTTAVHLRCFQGANPARLSQFQITAPAGSDVSIEDLRLVTPATEPARCDALRSNYLLVSLFPTAASARRPVFDKSARHHASRARATRRVQFIWSSTRVPGLGVAPACVMVRAMANTITLPARPEPLDDRSGERRR